jgi:phosphatidate phosphatase LPIN
MTDLVDQMFPPINRNCAPEFTDFNFWRTPVIEFPLPDLSPPSPALSARSDTSNQSALARLRNFSLVGTRQSNVKLTNLAVPAHGDEHRDSRLRQMSSFERLTSPFSSLGPSSGSSQGGRRRSLSPGSYSSSSMTYLDSGSEGDDDRGEGSGGEKRNRRLRRYSVTSMPGALDDLHLGNNDEEEDGADGAEDRAEGDTDGAYVEDEAEAAEHAFDEDFFATGEMKNVPFL